MRKNLLFLIFIIIPLLLSTGAAGYAQQINFDHISVDKGLLSTSVYTITQSEDGFLWFGTQNGLNQYDGYNFRPFTYAPNMPHGLSDNWIQALCNDHVGNLWVGTSNGLSRLDRDKEIFYNYFSDSSKAGAIASNKIWCILEASDKTLWVGTDKGLCRYNRESDSFEKFLVEPNQIGAFVSNAIDAIAEDKAGNIWVGTWGSGIAKLDKASKKLQLQARDSKGNSRLSNSNIKALKFSKDGTLWIGTHGGGLNKFDPNTGALKVYQHQDNNTQSLSNNYVLSLYEDKNNHIWVGTYAGGLNQLDVQQNTFRHFVPDPLDRTTLHGRWITSIFEDKGGNLWLSHENGISKFSTKGLKFQHYQPEPRTLNSIPRCNINSIFEDKEGLMWFGLWGEGVSCFNRKTNSFSHYKVRDRIGLTDGRVWDLCEDNKGQIWLGTSTGLLVLDKKTGRATDFDKNISSQKGFYQNISNLVFDEQRNSMWIGTWGGGMYLYNLDTKSIQRFVHEAGNPNSLAADRTKYLYLDQAGDLWIATSDAGLNKLILHKNGEYTFEHYFYQPDNPNSLSNNSPMVIYEDSKQRLWIGTSGGGLNCFSRKTKEFKRYFPDKQQKINSIYGILEDEKGNLWMSTNHGITRFEPDTEKFTNFDESDGLQSNAFQFGHKKSKDGAMWFGGHNGFNAFYPATVKESEYVPPIVLTELRVFNEEVHVGNNHIKPINHSVVLPKPLYRCDEIILQYSDQVLSFGFAALDFKAPHKNLYAYMLENFESKWNYTDATKRYATYTNLDPGEYIFKVKATNSDGVWNETPATIKVIIKPPVWLTWWFKSLLGITIVVALFGAFRFRIHQVESKKRELEEQVNHRTAEIYNQKEEILTQRDDIAMKNLSLQEAYSVIAMKNMDINSSLRYALRIQQALLPQEKMMKQMFADLFILFKPRDVVSGDFFWFSKKGPKMYMAIVDCTGHGVPGAFMSILAHGIINQILHDRGTSDPAEVLSLMQEEVTRVLKQDESDNHDGMDVAFCVIDTLENTLTYAGARSPLYYIENGELQVIKGNQYPIGGFVKDRGGNEYISHTISLQNNPSFYMFTDGYRDQIGGEKGKKFLGKRFRELLKQGGDLSMAAQQQMLEEQLASWTSNQFEQTDDILVVGFKV